VSATDARIAGERGRPGGGRRGNGREAPAHYVGVSKTLQPIPIHGFQGLERIVTSLIRTTNSALEKRRLRRRPQSHGAMQHSSGEIRVRNCGHVAGSGPDIAFAISRAWPRPIAQGATVVIRFSSYFGPFCNTGSWCAFPDSEDPEMVQALGDLVRGGIAPKPTPIQPSPRRGARKEFPGSAGLKSSTRRSPRSYKFCSRRSRGDQQDPGRRTPGWNADLSRQRKGAFLRSDSLKYVRDKRFASLNEMMGPASVKRWECRDRSRGV